MADDACPSRSCCNKAIIPAALEIRPGYAALHRLTRVRTAYGPTYKPDYGPKRHAERKGDRYSLRRGKPLWRQVARRLAVVQISAGVSHAGETSQGSMESLSRRQRFVLIHPAHPTPRLCGAAALAASTQGDVSRMPWLGNTMLERKVIDLS